MRTQKNVSLKRFAAFHIGGRASVLITAESPEEAAGAVLQLERERRRYRVFAGGSNIVFPDKGVACALLRMFGGKVVVKDRNSCRMEVDAGVLLGDVILRTISLGWKGLESLSGIPGTIGGAVFGNAGAYGRSISEVVEAVQVLEPGTGGKIRWIGLEECEFGYRESVFKKGQYIILRVRLRFSKGISRELRKISREIIALREKKYKPGLRCPGSFFKNVLVKDTSVRSLSFVDCSKIIDGKIPAGWLLEQIGARGLRVGQVRIADFHGNLFVNTGRGTAEEVKKMARLLKARVKRRFGIRLDEEVRYF